MYLALQRVLRRQDANGSGNGYVVPATVTRRSCIASRSALCVFGVARFISSASSNCVKTGPRSNSKCIEPVASV